MIPPLFFSPDYMYLYDRWSGDTVTREIQGGEEEEAYSAG